MNLICTSKCGQHISYIAEKVAARLAVTLKKKNKGGTEIKGNQIKNHLCAFVNCLIKNPVSDSQTKDFLIACSNAFGLKCDPSEIFVKKVDKSHIVNNIVAFPDSRLAMLLKRREEQRKRNCTALQSLMMQTMQEQQNQRTAHLS